MTDSDEDFEEMEQLGEGPHRLAMHLRALRRQHDMAAILAILKEIS